MECLGLVANYKSKIKNKKDISIEESVEIVKNLIHPKKYISFNEKQQLIINMLKDVIDYSENNMLVYNSCKKYKSFILTLLSAYTDLRIDEHSYDILCSNDLLNITVASLGSEYEICLGILDMYMSDLEHNRLDLRKM